MQFPVRFKIIYKEIPYKCDRKPYCCTIAGMRWQLKTYDDEHLNSVISLQNVILL